MAQRNIWVGDLDPQADDHTLRSMFAHIGDIENVKIMRSRESNICSGYGFVTFNSHEAALQALELNGQPIPNTNKSYRLNWGSGGSQNDVSIYVGDLPFTITDEQLFNIFKPTYPSVRSARVLVDHVGRSKGFGFVRFGDAAEASQAIVDMNGQPVFGKPIRVSTSSGKGAPITKSPLPPPRPPMQHPSLGFRQAPTRDLSVPPFKKPNRTETTFTDSMNSAISIASDPNERGNCTVFIGNLPPNVDQFTIPQIFASFGTIVNTKVIPAKGIAFVQFDRHDSAAAAITGLHGHIIGSNQIRLGWGKQGSGTPRPFVPNNPPPYPSRQPVVLQNQHRQPNPPPMVQQRQEEVQPPVVHRPPPQVVKREEEAVKGWDWFLMQSTEAYALQGLELLLKS
ncbi:hypothetical protein GEMRC1_004177 [Eukaryota sp. GEM-RC1]